MQRYFLYVSYIGTQFRGVQKIIHYNEPYKPDPTTIQGCLEIALERLKSINKPNVVPSSRTDTGVHAIQSTFHVDLLRPNSEPYICKGITTVLNRHFHNEDLPIRILETLRVSQNFHCRYNAKSRVYLYRLAILKNKYFKDLNRYIYHLPIEEFRRCYFLSVPEFNIDKMQSAAKLFEGLHDFRTFMGKETHQPRKMTRRTVEFLTVTEATPAAILDEKFKNEENIYNYWNITIKSEGFLYNQVRRIVGALIAAGQGKVNEKEIKSMLQIPSHLSWNPKIIPAPSYGLYLCKVNYLPNDLKKNIIIE